MTSKELLTIYDVIRKAEFRRRELHRLIIQKRDDAAALRSSLGGVNVLGGIRTTPQEKYIDKASEYETQLTRTVRTAEELAKRFFYDVQRRVPWRNAKAIHGYITGCAPYCREYLQAVREMAQALTDGAEQAQEWNEAAKDFAPAKQSPTPQSKPLTEKQRHEIAVKIISATKGRRLSEIIELIRRKCKRRRTTEKGSREDETLYAQICALERYYVYGRQRCLTETELLYIELYMTNELTRGDIWKHADTIREAVKKLAAAHSGD